MDKTYEMLWDCRYCGTTKLLGKTHRHCPNCGASQENAPRYFPSDEEKVAVEDHQFVGADLICPACGTNASRAANNCGNCGSPLEGAKGVAVRRDQVQAEGAVFVGETAKDAEREYREARAPAPPPPAPKSKTPFVLGGVGCLVVLVVAAALVLCGWRKKAGFEVVAQTWTYSVDVERFDAVSDSGWCSDMPSGATDVTKTRAQRSTKKVEDGQDCKTRKVDQGDGTYKEKKECSPKYKDEPVMDDKCSYKLNKWKVVRTEKASGNASTAPHWPDAKLARTGECIGCEREGKRTETYSVSLKDAGGGASKDCDVDKTKWTSMKPGTRWNAEVRVMGGGVVCDSLSAQ